MIKNFLNLKYTIHVLCLVSLISFGIFGVTLSMYIQTDNAVIGNDTIKTAVGNKLKNSPSLTKNKVLAPTSSDKC
jgi:hypothetical protein